MGAGRQPSEAAHFGVRVVGGLHGGLLQEHAVPAEALLLPCREAVGVLAEGGGLALALRPLLMRFGCVMQKL